MSSLKLAKEDPSSSQSVSGKAVLQHSSKRARLESTSDEEEDEEDVESQQQDEIEEEEEVELPQPEKTTAKSTKTTVKKSGSKKIKSDDNLEPIYEDFAPDTEDFNSAVEKIVQSYILKRSQEVIDKPKKQSPPPAVVVEQSAQQNPAKKSTKAAKEKAAQSSDKTKAQKNSEKFLVQLSKSFEVLQKKVNKALEDVNA